MSTCKLSCVTDSIHLPVRISRASHIHSCRQTCFALQVSPPKYLNSISRGQTPLKTVFLETLVDIWMVMLSYVCSHLCCCDSACRYCTRFCSWWKQHSGTWPWQWRQNATASCHLKVVPSTDNKKTFNAAQPK